MKKIFFIAIAFLIQCNSCAFASKDADNFLLISTMSLIDYHQSKKMFKSENFHELNPILSSRPTNEEMAIFGIVSLSFVYASSKMIENDTVKKILIDSIIATEKLNIEDNKRVMDGEKRLYDCLMIIISIEF